MADTDEDDVCNGRAGDLSPSSSLKRGTTAKVRVSSVLLRVMSKRRFWFGLFVTIYALLICTLWRTVRSALRYHAELQESAAGAWPALYASILLGIVFGVLAMVAMVAVAVPAMLVTWISILVLLAFAGKPREMLIEEGKRITRDIASFACKILLKEGNFVAAACALLSFFFLIYRGDDL